MMELGPMYKQTPDQDPAITSQEGLMRQVFVDQNLALLDYQRRVLGRYIPLIVLAMLMASCGTNNESTSRQVIIDEAIALDADLVEEDLYIDLTP